MDVSVIIVNWNTRELLLECLSSVYHTVAGLEIEVLVVDNGSHDGSSEAVKEGFPQAQLIQTLKIEVLPGLTIRHSQMLQDAMRSF